MAFNIDLVLTGYVGNPESFSLKKVTNLLLAKPDVELNVMISSLGGDVATALAIASAFEKHGNVVVHLAGMVASAATIASLGAKKIIIDKSASYLIHKAAVIVDVFQSMNTDQLEGLQGSIDKCKNELLKIDNTIAELYASKSGKTKEQVLDLMKQDTWKSPEEMLEFGLVDEINDTKNKEVENLQKSYINAVAMLGMPMPLINENKSLISRAAEKLNKILSPKIKNVMEKVYEFICKLLGVEKLVFEDGKTSLTEQQMDSIENELKANNEEIAKLKQDLEDCKNKPADKTTAVVNNGVDNNAGSDVSDFVKTAVDAKKLFDSLP